MQNHSVECMSIRMEMNSGAEHQLLYFDYHSNRFLPKQQAIHFVVLH